MILFKAFAKLGQTKERMSNTSESKSEMEKSKKHYVLVHGSCHGAWCWYKVATLLKSEGHKVSVLDLAACGIHPKQVHEVDSLSEYLEPLLEFMSSLPSEERVILVGHSMGGVSISVAMERFPNKVSVAVYAAALMPGPGLTFLTLKEELRRRFGSYMDSQNTFDHGPKNPPNSIIFRPKFLACTMHRLSPPEDLTLAMSLVRPDRLYGDKEADLTKDKYGSVRRVYIVCDQDEVMKEDFQRWMIENNPTNEVKVIHGSDHMVMFSKPKELCSYILEIAQMYS